jgi:hypothetical protein
MITEDYVSFKVAKPLKEKGFDEPTEMLIREDGTRYHADTNSVSRTSHIMLKNSEINIYSTDLSCPTIQMAMKWLREVHKIIISFNASFVNSIEQHFSWKVRINSLTSLNDEKHFEPIYIHVKSESFEDACEAAIKYCLENLI